MDPSFSREFSIQAMPKQRSPLGSMGSVFQIMAVVNLMPRLLPLMPCQQFDSGIRSGADVIRALALGADFVLAGRAFMFGVAAFGELGGTHATEILLADLKTNMAQLGVTTIDEVKELVPTVEGF